MGLDWAMVFSPSPKKIIFLFFSFFFFSFGFVNCTSGDKEDDSSVIEDGLKSIDDEISEGFSDDAEGDEDDEFADSEDEEDEEDDEFDEEDEELAQLDEEFADLDEEEDDEFDDAEDDEDDEFADLDDEDDEFADLDDEDDEFADLDDEDDEFADLDDEDDEFADLDDEDDEFADLDDEDDEFDDAEDDEDDEFADLDDEESDEEEDELVQNEEGEEGESSEFPEQVVGEKGEEQKQGEEPVVTSETKDIVAGETDSSLPQDDLGEADPISPDEGEKEETPGWVPVVKIKTDPFFRNNLLINAVYIVRPQDTMESIGKKIYGDGGRVEELNANNSHLARGIDPGDKVYYNSPNRPEDKSQLKFFYEDVGLEPQFYKTKEGDNMRRLGSRLLGFADGWKEIWAINQNVDSKTILPGGLQLRYWTGNEAPLQQIADVEEPVSQGVEENNVGGSVEMPKEPEEVGTTGVVTSPPSEPQTPPESPLPPEPELPAEPPLPEPQMNMPENDLEPSEIADTDTFPESDAGMEQQQTPGPGAMSATEAESLVSVGALALLLLAGVILVVIQIKKRSGATTLNPSSLEYTQV